jgi:hypothetical protein
VAFESIKEIRLGCLWAVLLPVLYTILFVAVVLLFPREPIPDNLPWYEVIGLVLKLGLFGFLSLILYFILLIPVLIFSFVLGFKDPSIVRTLKVSWPFLLALLYIILPDFLPGPIDDIVVTFIASSIGAVLISRELRRGKEKQKKPGTLEIEVLPKVEKSTELDRPREIIDAEFEEKE